MQKYRYKGYTRKWKLGLDIRVFYLTCLEDVLTLKNDLCLFIRGNRLLKVISDKFVTGKFPPPPPYPHAKHPTSEHTVTLPHEVVISVGSLKRTFAQDSKGGKKRTIISRFSFLPPQKHITCIWTVFKEKYSPSFWNTLFLRVNKVGKPVLHYILLQSF